MCDTLRRTFKWIRRWTVMKCTNDGLPWVCSWWSIAGQVEPTQQGRAKWERLCWKIHRIVLQSQMRRRKTLMYYPSPRSIPTNWGTTGNDGVPDDEWVPSFMSIINQGINCVSAKERSGDVWHVAECQFVISAMFVSICIERWWISTDSWVNFSSAVRTCLSSRIEIRQSRNNEDRSELLHLEYPSGKEE